MSDSVKRCHEAYARLKQKMPQVLYHMKQSMYEPKDKSKKTNYIRIYRTDDTKERPMIEVTVDSYQQRDELYDAATRAIESFLLTLEEKERRNHDS